MMPEHLGARRVLLGCDRKQATPPEAPPPGKEGRLWDLPVSAAPGLGEPGVQCHGVPTTAVTESVLLPGLLGKADGVGP